MRKVYCENCDYLSSGNCFMVDVSSPFCCKVIGEIDTPHRRAIEYAISEIHNAKNQCEYYKKRKVEVPKKKWWKFWIRSPIKNATKK